MVLLIEVVYSLIFCMIFLPFSGTAKNALQNASNVICVQKNCQKASNPFDITRKDEDGIENSKNYETNPGDMFHEIDHNPNIKKISEIHDNGYYTSLCWIEITTITEIYNGTKSAIREYAITFETPSDIPEKYISKRSENISGETIQYKIFDRDTRKSEVVNFTTISESKESIVRQNRKVLCGSGPIYTKEFLEWPHSDRKRVEIRVSPKRQSLVASDCIVLNANLEHILPVQSVPPDYDVPSSRPPTVNDSKKTGIFIYPKPKNSVTISPTKAQPPNFHNSTFKDVYTDLENLPKITSKDSKTEPSTIRNDNTETTINRISSSPDENNTLLEGITEFKERDQKPQTLFSSVTPKHPKHLKKSDLHISPLLPTIQKNLQPTTKESINEDINEDLESKNSQTSETTLEFASENTNVPLKNTPREMTENKMTNKSEAIDFQTELSNLHFATTTSMKDILFVNKNVTQEVMQDGITSKPTKVLFEGKDEITDKTSSTIGTDKKQHLKANNLKLKHIQMVTKVTSNPQSKLQNYQVKKTSRPLEYTDWEENTNASPIPKDGDKFLEIKSPVSLIPPNKLVLNVTTKGPDVNNYSDIYPFATEEFLKNAVSLLSGNGKHITTEQPTEIANNATTTIVQTKFSPKPSKLSRYTNFNTLVTKRVRSGIQRLVTSSKMNHTSLKKNDAQTKPKDIYLKETITEKTKPVNIVGFTRKSTASQYDGKIPLMTSSNRMETHTRFPSSKGKNILKSVTTPARYTNTDLGKSPFATKALPADFYSPYYYTSNLLESFPKSTTNFDISEHRKTEEIISSTPYETVSVSNDLSYQTSYSTNEEEILNPERFQINTSRTDSNNALAGTFTTTQTLPDFYQKYVTVSETPLNEKETTIKDLKIFESNEILTELPFTSSQQRTHKKKPQHANEDGSSKSTTIFLDLLDKTRSTTTSNIQSSDIIASFYGPLFEQPSSAIDSENLIEQYKSTTKQNNVKLFPQTSKGISNVLDQTSTSQKSVKMPSHTKTASASVNFNDAKSIKPEQNTYSTNDNIINEYLVTTANEIKLIQTETEKPKHSILQNITPANVLGYTDIYFTQDVTASNSLPNQFDRTTKIKKKLLTQKQGTSLEIPVYTETEVPSELLASYTPEDITVEPITGYTIISTATNYSKKFNEEPEMDKNSVNLYFRSTKIPNTVEYISLNPVKKPYSNIPITNNQFNIASRPFKYTNDIFEIGVSRTSEPTTKYIHLEQQSRSKIPFIHRDHSTSTAKPFFLETLEKHKNQLKYDVDKEDEFTNNDSSTERFTSSEIFEESQFTQKVPDNLSIKYSTDTETDKEDLTSSDRILDPLYGTTQNLKLGSNARSQTYPKYSKNIYDSFSVTPPGNIAVNSFTITSQRAQHSSKFYERRPSLYTNNSAIIENSTSSEALLDTTQYSNLKQKSQTEKEKKEYKSHLKTTASYPDDSEENLPSSIEPQKPTILKNTYYTSGTLNYPYRTTVNTFPLFSIIYPYEDNKHLNTLKNTVKNLAIPTKKTNYELFESNTTPTNRDSSTDTLTNILKKLDKSLCNNTKQKILVRVKILMEHIFENNESGTTRKQVIPILGIEKNREFDIKPKKKLPVVPYKKLNKDWNIFLDDLAKNFFDFNRHMIDDYSDLKPKILDLEVPGYEYSGGILSPRDSMQRMQRIRNAMNRCKKNYENRFFNGEKLVSQLRVDDSVLSKKKNAVDKINRKNNVEIITTTQDVPTSAFYKFLIGSSKIIVPSEQINILKTLNDERRKRITENYRVGYNQLSLTDIYPISSKTESSGYIPTTTYYTASNSVPEIIRSHSVIKDNDKYVVLPLHNSRESIIEVVPRMQETSFARFYTNDVDVEETTAKIYKDIHKVENNNLMSNNIKHAKDVNKVHANTDTVNPTFRNLPDAESKNGFLGQTSEDLILGSKSTDADYQDNEKINLNPINENVKGKSSTSYKFFNFRSILDGIVNKLNIVLKKLSNN